MDADICQLVFFSILTVAVLIWAYSLRKAAHFHQAETPATDPWAPVSSFEPETFVATGFAETHGVTGTQTLRGDPETLSKVLGRLLLATGVPGMFAGLFDVVERTPERLAVRKTGPLVCNQPSGLYFSEAEFEFRRTAENTVEVTYRLGFERLAKGLRKTALALILGLGLPVMIIIAVVIWIFVVSSENPVIRWQVFQTLQVAHVLWPPFLVMSFYRSGKNHSRTYVSNLLRSLDLAV